MNPGLIEATTGVAMTSAFILSPGGSRGRPFFRDLLGAIFAGAVAVCANAPTCLHVVRSGRPP